MIRKREIQPIINGIKKVKLNKLEDRGLSTALFKNFMLLCGKQREYEAERKDLQDLFLEKFKDEQNAVGRLQGDFNLEVDGKKRIELAKEINSHKEYLDAVKSLNEKIESLGNEEVEVEHIDAEKFGEAYQKQDDFDVSVVEEIYPLFKV